MAVAAASGRPPPGARFFVVNQLRGSPDSPFCFGVLVPPDKFCRGYVVGTVEVSSHATGVSTTSGSHEPPAIPLAVGSQVDDNDERLLLVKLESLQEDRMLGTFIRATRFTRGNAMGFMDTRRTDLPEEQPQPCESSSWPTRFVILLERLRLRNAERAKSKKSQRESTRDRVKMFREWVLPFLLPIIY